MNIEKGLIRNTITATEGIGLNPHTVIETGNIPLSSKMRRKLELAFDTSIHPQEPTASVLWGSKDGATVSPEAIALHLPGPQRYHARFTRSGVGYLPPADPLQSLRPISAPDIQPADLMGMLEIDQPPASHGDAYEQWLRRLLSRCGAWKYTEKMFIPDRFSDLCTTSLILQKHVEGVGYRNDIQTSSIDRHVVRSMEMPLPDGSARLARAALRVSTDYADGTILAPYRQHGRRTQPDTLFEQGEEHYGPRIGFNLADPKNLKGIRAAVDAAIESRQADQLLR